MAHQAIRSNPPWRISVDVGGTFTDMVVADAVGHTAVFKVPSVPADPGRGVIDAVNAACHAIELSARDFLGQCQYFLHGSTVATNTLLEGKGARVGLLTTRGFRDSLETRRGLRADPWDHRTPYPPVLVPRYLRLPVRGRIDSQGVEIQALALSDVKAAVDVFRQEKVEAVAVCLINSFANPAHEQEVARYLTNLAHFEFVSVSSRVAPIMGEYERTSTTVINACLMPRVASYLDAMQTELIQMGLKTRLLVLQSNGGAASLAQLLDRPVSLLLSGPAAGVGALHHLAQTTGRDNLLTMEIGGTSCDVMLMQHGQVAVTDSLVVDDYDLITPSIDIHTVGAGGGTIAGIDKAGMPFAGPAGAGADPGPAAYGLGGAHPTVTDAQLILGRLRPGPYAGGSVSLDAQSAARALDERLAKPAGITREAAAAGVIQLVEQNLLHAVERISMQRGHNPKDLTLVACGGAGPMHGVSVGRRLGTHTVYIPRDAGAFCAMGMQYANVRRDFVQELGQALTDDVRLTIDTLAADLSVQAQAALALEGFSVHNSSYAISLDLHYSGQQWDVNIAAPERASASELQTLFEAEYERLFGHTNPANTVIVARVRLTSTGVLPALETLRHRAVSAPAEAIQMRSVFSQIANQFLDTPVFDGPALQCGQKITGPAIIEEQTTTIVVDQGDTVRIDELNNYVVNLAHA